MFCVFVHLSHQSPSRPGVTPTSLLPTPQSLACCWCPTNVGGSEATLSPSCQAHPLLSSWCLSGMRCQRKGGGRLPCGVPTYRRSSLTWYGFLDVQIDVKLVSSLSLEAFAFIHALLCGEQEALCQSHARVFIFGSLLRREALTNLGTRVKKSRIITTSNNRIAICSLRALQSAISFNPQDNLVRLVLLPSLCRGGNSG